MSDVRTDKGFNKMTPFWMCRKWSIFFLISSTLLYVTLSSVKEFEKTLTSSLAEIGSAHDGERIGGAHTEKVVRGGGFYFWPERVSVSLRLNVQPHINDRIGVRPARALVAVDALESPSERVGLAR
jgi:hypothetical protein